MDSEKPATEQAMVNQPTEETPITDATTNSAERPADESASDDLASAADAAIDAIDQIANHDSNSTDDDHDTSDTADDAPLHRHLSRLRRFPLGQRSRRNQKQRFGRTFPL